MYKLAIFDLDGVLVDTAKYHYLAWKALADKLGFVFTHEHNERLKGVSRARSLEILLEVGGMRERFSEEEKLAMMTEKNDLYVSYLDTLDESELLNGAKQCLITLRERGIKTALGSASKNSPMILDKLGITSLFDAIIDGNCTQRAKPDPEVFTMGADKLGVPRNECVVFEDAAAGVEAAIAAGMLPVGVGKPENLPGAHMWVDSLGDFDIDSVFTSQI